MPLKRPRFTIEQFTGAEFSADIVSIGISWLSMPQKVSAANQQSKYTAVPGFFALVNPTEHDYEEKDTEAILQSTIDSHVSLPILSLLFVRKHAKCSYVKIVGFLG